MAKKPSSSRKLSLYSNLSHKRKTRKDAESRNHAQYLASLPKHPVKRLIYRLNPKTLAAYWFSKRGALMALKVAGIGILLILLLIGGLFAYFRKDLDSIRPEELSKRVQTSVTKYLDRNGNLLWEDTGNGNYKLVVASSELSPYLKNATVAVEDKNFYNNNGISITGLARATINNFAGGDTQGASTLTQQLVKQVFFADQSSDRGIGGVPRKIKEIILALEVDRIYNKDQILTLYLNESPYGGRRNGAESAAQTYFGKSAKDLTLAEASLLAAIPQNPSNFNPYNISGHEGLIARQHIVLDDMVEQKYITKAQSDQAKAIAILDSLKPEANQYANIKAPHFVQMVRQQLISQLGAATVGQGGLTIKTTLDIRIQNKLEESMKAMFSSYIQKYAGFTNGAATVEDSQSGQIIAMMGSRDFNYQGFGQDNAAVAYIQPGSTVKPLIYAALFNKQPAGKPNYGSGSILADDNIDNIYGAQLRDADRKFLGNIPIRKSLALSRNIPAVKSMYIMGVKPTIDTIHALGNSSYCTQGVDVQVGLAAAIGGCGNRQVDQVNAFASLARGGAYKEQSSILEVKNSSGEVLKKWTDNTFKQIVDPQAAYIVNDILTDDNARAGLEGRNAKGFVIPGVKTASKTGTSDVDGNAKDIWMMSYSPAITMGVWLGNSDTTPLKNGTSSIPAPIIASVMSYAHLEIYAPEGKWKSGDWFTQPAGIQTINGELYPAWWSKSQGQSNAKIIFDKVSKFKATACTPEGAKISIDVVKTTDPVTKTDIYSSPDGYDATKDDNAHQCSDVGPSAPTVKVTPVVGSTNQYTIEVSLGAAGTFPGVSSVDIKVGTTIVTTIQAPGPYTYTYTVPSGTGAAQAVSATVTDTGYYVSAASATSSSVSPNP